LAPVPVAQQQVSGVSASTAHDASFHAIVAEGGPDQVNLANNAPLQQDTTPPTVLSVEPADGSTDVAVESTVVANFSEPIVPASIQNGFTLMAPGNTVVASTTSWDPANNRAILTPTSPLAPGTVFTATMTGAAADAAGNTLGADLVWHFATSNALARSIWGDDELQGYSTIVETDNLEVGLRFRSTIAGYITHARIYRHIPGGSFVASLWSGSGGSLLARNTTHTITTPGWQEVAFTTPVQIQPNTIYVVAFSIPVGVEHVYNLNYFTEDVVNPPFFVPGGVEENGVYGAMGTFPNIPYQAYNAWIDVVFEPLEQDTVAPTIHSRMPEPASVNLDPATNVTVRFDEAMNPSTINASTFRLRASGASQDVPATVSYNTNTHSATLNPASDLAPGTLYNVTVAATVADVAGNSLGTASTWSFTTGSPATRATLWTPVNGPTGSTYQEGVDLELGTIFQSDVAGEITGLRFYRQSTGGAFTVSLWSGDGNLLASTISPDVTAVGWQEAHLSTPVGILADTDYVVSYRVPTNIPFSASLNYFTADVVTPPLTAPGGVNGVYEVGGLFPDQTESNINYWVEPVLRPTGEDTTPPVILSRLPEASASNVAVESNVTVQFSEAMNASTINASTFTLRAVGATEDIVAVVIYNAGTHTATLNPDSNLAADTVYNVTVAATVADTSGNTLGAPATWQFTTRKVSLGITWNLLSIPNNVGPNATIAEALAPIEGQYALVYAYQGCTEPCDPWRVYNPADVAGSTLQTHDPMAGYWVFLTESTHLEPQGMPFLSLSVDLRAGWNLIGVPYSEAVPVDDAIAACGNSVKMFYSFDLGAEGDPWLQHRPGAVNNDFDNLEPGRAYWVFTSEACTLGN